MFSKVFCQLWIFLRSRSSLDFFLLPKRQDASPIFGRRSYCRRGNTVCLDESSVLWYVILGARKLQYKPGFLDVSLVQTLFLLALSFLIQILFSWPQAADELLEDMYLPTIRSGGSWFNWVFKIIDLKEIATLGEERWAIRKKSL